MADFHKHKYEYRYVIDGEPGEIDIVLSIINRNGYELVSILRGRGDSMYIFYDKNPKES